MFVYNLKLNGNKLFKCFFILTVLFLIVIISIIFLKLFKGANNVAFSSCMPNEKNNTILAKNYTNVLKSVHDNIDNYIGTRITFTGYIYRVSDLTDNQFILARNMIISSDFQYVVVGFLCESEFSKNFTDGSWVTITGEITKGNYHGDMPIIKILKIENSDKPNEEFVYPPDKNYIPTTNIL